MLRFPAPFLKFLVLLVLGLLLSRVTTFPLSYSVLAFFVSGGSLILFIFLEKYFTWRLPHWSAYHLLTSFLLVSGGLCLGQRFELSPEWTDDDNVVVIKGIVVSETEKKQGYCTVVTEIHTLLTEKQKPKHGAEKMLVYIDSSERYSYRFGNEIWIKGNLIRFAGPPNPYQFDKKSYYAAKGIHFFLKPKQPAVVLDSNRATWIETLAFRLRTMADNHFSRFVRAEEKGIATALILGLKGFIPEETRNDYALTGTLHVLAVSGLHVGILYVLLVYLFKRIPFLQNHNWFMQGSIIAVLWLYALVTGLSASVLRATAMFTLFAIGECLGKKGASLNTLSASAFFLLLLNPGLLYDLGFQLSFTAVAGIICLYPAIYKQYTPKKQVMKWLWSSICLSVAAQAGTLPLTLYYFHQFPAYFLLSNLVAVPFSGFILYTGMAFMVSAPFAFLAKWLGLLVGWQVSTLNTLMHLLACLPGSAINAIFLQPVEALLLAMILILFSYGLITKRLVHVYLSCALMAGLSAYRTWNKIDKMQSTRLAFYHIPGKTAFTIKEGTTGSIVSSEGKVPYFVKTHTASMGMATWKTKEIKSKGYALWMYRNKTLLLLSKTLNFKPNVSPLSADVVILTNNAVKSIHQLRQYVNASCVIVDGSNYPSLVQKLQKEGLSAGIRFLYTGNGMVEI